VHPKSGAIFPKNPFFRDFIKKTYQEMAFPKTCQETAKKPSINKNIFIIYFILYVLYYKYLFILFGKKSQCFRAYPI
jgi:hypothetical protein